MSKDACFCFCCLFLTSKIVDNKSKAFIQGTDKWKNIGRDLKEHSESNAHCTSFNLWVNRQSVEANGKTCASLVSSQHAKIVKKNTDNLKTIIRVVYFLSLQGLAFRGNDVSDLSSNRGNFLELIELLSEFNNNLKEHPVKNNNAKYTSATSQNQIISLIAQQIKLYISNSVQDYYSIIVDETMDISRVEQFSFCIRYCTNELKVHEKFLGFYDMPERMLNAFPIK